MQFSLEHRPFNESKQAITRPFSTWQLFDGCANLHSVSGREQVPLWNSLHTSSVSHFVSRIGVTLTAIFGPYGALKLSGRSGGRAAEPRGRQGGGAPPRSLPRSAGSSGLGAAHGRGAGSRGRRGAPSGTHGRRAGGGRGPGAGRPGGSARPGGGSCEEAGGAGASGGRGGAAGSKQGKKRRRRPLEQRGPAAARPSGAARCRPASPPAWLSSEHGSSAATAQPPPPLRRARRRGANYNMLCATAGRWPSSRGNGERPK